MKTKTFFTVLLSVCFMIGFVACDKNNDILEDFSGPSVELKMRIVKSNGADKVEPIKGRQFYVAYIPTGSTEWKVARKETNSSGYVSFKLPSKDGKESNSFHFAYEEKDIQTRISNIKNKSENPLGVGLGDLDYAELWYDEDYRLTVKEGSLFIHIGIKN